MYALTDVIAILFLVGVFYALGFRIVRRTHSQDLPEQPHPDTKSASQVTSLERRQILLNALNEPLYTEILSPVQREQLRHALLNPGDAEVGPAPADDFEAPAPDLAATPKPVVQQSAAFVPPAQTQSAFQRISEPDSQPALASAASAVTVSEERVVSAPVGPPKPPRKPVMDTIRASWDPAVMLLYVGALLVVVAGLIFATYNWGTLGGWQKLGILAAGTIAFLIGGFAIRNIERVKPASTTFIVIGGLLVPANFLAAYTVFDDVQPALPLLMGAIATTVIHGLLSYQAGASLFRYSAAGAGIVAIAAVPAAAGFPAGWGGVLGLIVIALLPDSMFGTSRFRKAWHVTGRIASGLLAGFALWQGWNEHGWMVAGALVSVAMVATRFSQRYPDIRVHLLVFADLALIAASMQIAHNLDGDRWMVAAGLLALTLVLQQETRRFELHTRWLEFAAAISTSLLVSEIVRVLGSDSWAIAAGFGVLAALMLLHARRHANLAFLSEAIAALALPVSLGTAVYAVDPSLWSLVVGLAAFTITSVWLGLRREYPARWPGISATVSVLGVIITLVPAIGPDVAWGCIAALLVIAIAPYPFGRLNSFRLSWLRFANLLALPIALIALLRGPDVHDWLIPLALVAISMWLHRLAIEEVLDAAAMQIAADVAAVLAGISVAWVLRDEQWLVAAGLLGISLVLIKWSYAWSIWQSRLQFAAAITLAMLAGEVVREFTDAEWGIVAGAAALTITMLVHARLHPRRAWIGEGVTAWSFPFAVGAGLYTYNQTDWFLPVGAGVLTLTLIGHRIRHRRPGDIMLAIASITGILTAMEIGRLLGVGDDPRHMATLFTALALVVTAIANAVLPPFESVSSWLKNLLRFEAVVLLFFALAVGGSDYGLVFVASILATFWNLWISRAGIWSLPMAGAITAAWMTVVMPTGVSNGEYLWWALALAAVLTAIAWQLDRRSGDTEEQLHAGIHTWIVMALITSTFHISWIFGLSDGEANVWYGIALLLGSGLHAIGYLSTRSVPHIVLGGLLAVAANVVFIVGDVSAVEHGIISVTAGIISAALYLRAAFTRLWLAFTVLVLAVVHFQLATDFAYSRDLLLGLVVAWILMSLAIARWRTDATASESTPIVYQAMLLHGLALVLPLLDHTVEQITRPDFVLVLVSLAGVVGTFGSLRRNRELVLLGSAFGMFAFMLQISIGSPGNLHAYTVPLSIYLIAVGLLFRRDARIANTLLAAGSAMLVIPAMIEALTTGEIMWLWIALAESLGLFLFGTVLRLRIPTAAGVVAISVIALRMLVFAVSVLASWVSILVVGVVLLLVGTMWLLFREEVQSRAKSLFSRWQDFE